MICPPGVVTVRLREPLWDVQHRDGANQTTAVSQSHAAVLQDEAPITAQGRAGSGWNELLQRTANAFDESRAQGGFLKTYVPIDVSHLAMHEQTTRRAHLREAGRRSRAI